MHRTSISGGMASRRGGRRARSATPTKPAAPSANPTGCAFVALFVGVLLTPFGTFRAGEALSVEWLGRDLALLWLSAFYVVAALVLVSGWRRGTVRRRGKEQLSVTGVSR
jgi:hypothetical protein